MLSPSRMQPEPGTYAHVENLEAPRQEPEGFRREQIPHSAVRFLHFEVQSLGGGPWISPATGSRGATQPQTTTPLGV
jgi:hypothetical protein